MKDKKIPIYVGDFSDYDIQNVPMSAGMRWTLVDFLRDLLESQEKFETMFAIPFTEKYRKLCRTLLVPLTTNLRPKENREPTRRAIADYETATKTVVLPEYQTPKTASRRLKKNLSQATGTARFIQLPPLKTVAQATSILTLIYVLVFICSIL